MTETWAALDRWAEQLASGERKATMIEFFAGVPKAHGPRPLSFSA